jgi:hypothetical protein
MMEKVFPQRLNHIDRASQIRILIAVAVMMKES